MYFGQNCWEYKNCGRQPNGRKVLVLGVCPAAQDMSFDGLNGGMAAGRICWAVAGTYCGGRIQGTFAEKLPDCMNCSFFKLVKREVGTNSFKFLKPKEN